MKLNILAFGLACGLVWGVGILVTPWWVMLFEGSTGDWLALGHVYRGFNVSPVGSLVGFVWGLCDGFVGGVILAALYNFFASCRMK